MRDGNVLLRRRINSTRTYDLIPQHYAFPTRAP